MLNKHFQRAYTLVELILTISIMGILLSLAVPTFGDLLQRQRGLAAINSLADAFQTARNSSIMLKVPVTFCAKMNEDTCGKDWRNGALAFADRNRNSIVDAGERMINVVAALPAGSTLRISTFGNRSYIRFTPQGFIENYSAGNMVYCAPGNNLRHAQNLIFTRMGRLRFGDDKNNDGINEDSNGQPLTCR